MGTLAQPLIATPPWHGLGGTGTRQQAINRLASFPISTPTRGLEVSVELR
jgi:hypothetical protein